MNWLQWIFSPEGRRNSKFNHYDNTRVVLRNSGFGDLFYPEFKCRDRWLPFLDSYCSSGGMFTGPARYNTQDGAEDFIYRQKLKKNPKELIVSVQYNGKPNKKGAKYGRK